MVMPTALAALHQANGVALLTMIVWTAFELRPLAAGAPAPVVYRPGAAGKATGGRSSGAGTNLGRSCALKRFTSSLSHPYPQRSAVLAAGRMAGLYFWATGFVFQRDEKVSLKDFSTKLTVSAHRHKREVQVLSWRHAKALLVVISALVFGASLTPALNGCTGDRSGADRVAQAIGVDPYRLDDEGARELARFNHVFTTYADNPSDIREMKQFRDVYKRIRANYVTPVNDTALIDAALKGAVKSDAAPGSVPSSSLVDAALESMTASLDPHSAYLDPDALKESELVRPANLAASASRSPRTATRSRSYRRLKARPRSGRVCSPAISSPISTGRPSPE